MLKALSRACCLGCGPPGPGPAAAYRRQKTDEGTYSHIGYPVLEVRLDARIASTNAAARTFFGQRPASLLEVMSYVDTDHILFGAAATQSQHEVWWDGRCLRVADRHDNSRVSGCIRLLVIASRSHDDDAIVTLSIVPIAGPIRSMLETWFRHQLPSDVISNMAECNDGSMPIRSRFVTILFVDIVGFTPMASHVDPLQVLEMLDSVFGTIEREIVKYPRIMTYETDGDCWIGISGVVDKDSVSGRFSIEDCSNSADEKLQTRQSDALAILTVASVVRTAMAGFMMPDGQPMKLRFGLHSGPVVLGLRSGRIKLAGDVINTAKRIEAACPLGAINMSASTYELLPVHMKAFCKKHDAVLKGKGATTMYCVP